jgi:hypothetical protein
MALVTGPLHSDTASGTFAKSLVFSVWKGRPYVRERVTPTNPKSAKQTGVRSLLGFIAQLWTSISVPNKATWVALAAQKSISPFNAYASENLSRWQNFFAPTRAYPAAEAASAIAVTTMGLTGGIGNVTIILTPASATAIESLFIFRGTAEITAPSWQNCIAVIPADGVTPQTWVDTPLVAGTYHYRSAVGTTDGVLGAVKADATAVVS